MCFNDKASLQLFCLFGKNTKKQLHKILYFSPCEENKINEKLEKKCFAHDREIEMLETPCILLRVKCIQFSDGIDCIDLFICTDDIVLTFLQT